MYTLGTAGHVDHGKSTLVQSLTGINPDRWEEEQRREMTIDLGFAWLATPAGRAVSLVDVPGHERFIKNMLAGVGGLDAVLFVIAADEGIQPQTIEHRQIIDLLGIEHALIVLTKCDLVDAEWRDLMIEEVRDGLRDSVMAFAPIVPVSARTGAGMAELLHALDRLLDDVPTRTVAAGVPRLPIDRAFSIGGFGTVVTGTLLDGPLHVGDEIEILPAGLRGRVRGIQTHQTKHTTALPGTRVAINLSGIERSAISRGDVLTLPNALQPTTLIDVQLRLAADAPVLLHNDPLDLFVGAVEVACHVALLDQETLLPGSFGWVQLRLHAPIAVQRGDRCIVRRASPSRTVGGGVIVDPHPPRHRRFRPAVVANLETLARGTPLELLAQVLADGIPLAWRTVVERSGLDAAIAEAALREGCNNGTLLIVTLEGESQKSKIKNQNQELGIGNRESTSENLELLYGAVSVPVAPVPPLPFYQPPTTVIISATGWTDLQATIMALLRDYHARWPLRRGISREEVRSRLALGARLFNDVLARAASEEWLVDDTASLHLPDHSPTPTAVQQRAISATLAQWRAAPTTPPGRETLDALDPEVLAWLVTSEQLVKVSAEVYLLAETYAAMRRWVDERLQTAQPLTLAAFRDAWTTTRKYAQAFLEHLDDLKVTKRLGDERVQGRGTK